MPYYVVVLYLDLGYTDIAIGDCTYGNYAGAVYVVYGQAAYNHQANTSSSFLGNVKGIDMANLAANGQGFAIYNSLQYQYFGYSIRYVLLVFVIRSSIYYAKQPTHSPIGDFNGDGYPDIIIGAPVALTGRSSVYSRAYIVYGGKRTADLEISSFTLADGIILTSGEYGEFCGGSVSSAGGKIYANHFYFVVVNVNTFYVVCLQI